MDLVAPRKARRSIVCQATHISSTTELAPWRRLSIENAKSNSILSSGSIFEGNSVDLGDGGAVYALDPSGTPEQQF